MTKRPLDTFDSLDTLDASPSKVARSTCSIPMDIWANELIPKYIRYMPATLRNMCLVSKAFREFCDQLQYWYYIWQ